MNRSASESPEAEIFFLDECLGGEKVADTLVRAGFNVKRHHECFARGTQDKDWLPTVGQNGWILLTQDKGIRHRNIEITVLRQHGVKAFVVAAKNLRGEEIGQLIVDSVPKIRQVLRRHDPPIVATITRGGVVDIRESKPRYPKPGRS